MWCPIDDKFKNTVTPDKYEEPYTDSIVLKNLMYPQYYSYNFPLRSHLRYAFSNHIGEFVGYGIDN